jgi:hypothetical protein
MPAAMQDLRGFTMVLACSWEDNKTGLANLLQTLLSGKVGVAV